MKNAKFKWLSFAVLLLTAAYISWYFYTRPKYITASACLKWDATFGSKAGVQFPDLKGCEKLMHFAISRDAHPMLEERGSLGSLDVQLIHLLNIKIWGCSRLALNPSPLLQY